MTPDIGAAIREARLDVGMTQEELADAIGVSRQTVSQLERGLKADVGVYRLEAIAKACKTSIFALLYPLKIDKKTDGIEIVGIVPPEPFVPSVQLRWRDGFITAPLPLSVRDDWVSDIEQASYMWPTQEDEDHE